MYNIQYLDRSFNNQMLEIMRSAPIITNSITLCFDRYPDVFKMTDIKYEFCQYLGFLSENSLKGFAMNGYYDALINGKKETVFHLANIYIKPEARAKGFSYKIYDNFYKETYKNARIGYAIIMEGNNDALRLVGRRHPRFPSSPWARFINKLDVKSILLTWPVKLDSSYKIRHAAIEDIPIIVSLLNEEHKNRLFGSLYSTMTFENLISKRTGLSISDYYLALDKKENICGVCAAWDCNSFKQNRVLKYGTRFLPARIGHRLLEGILGLAPLPAKGDSFKDITISEYAVKDRNVNIMRALLKSVYEEYLKKGYHTLTWGSSIDDPLLKAADGFFHESIVSNIILLATKQEFIEDEVVNNNLPYIDLACL